MTTTPAPARYVYLGDKLTDPSLVGQPCDPIRRADGKCLVGRSPRNQAVRFEDGRTAVVLARRLRLIVTPITLTRSVLLRSQPITAGDSTSDKEGQSCPARGERPLSTGGPDEHLMNRGAKCIGRAISRSQAPDVNYLTAGAAQHDVEPRPSTEAHA